MRVAALISGGKDSCYNMLQCVAAGHDIVALANLLPENSDELDSYMYQTVGHQGIEAFAEAVNLPLFRQVTNGKAIQQDKMYTPTAEDEVEDLFLLLNRIKEEMKVEAVAVGAIYSDYQRIRVENVCARLGLFVLSYLWRRDQEELLQEMIDCDINAIIIKVAALGLNPNDHLGISLQELQPHILKMKEKYGLNVCGEGGEFETFTLDCPLFVKTIVIDELETVIHSDDAIAPVGYLNFKKIHLVEKDGVSADVPLIERLQNIPVKTWRELTNDLDEDVTFCHSEICEESLEEELEKDSNELKDNFLDTKSSLGIYPEIVALPDNPNISTNDAGWTWFGGILGQGQDCIQATRQALEKLNNLLEKQYMAVKNLVAISLYVRDISQYAMVNEEYIQTLGEINPPVRICVDVPLPVDSPVLIEGVAHPGPRHNMHVQGISHWAPANIGPYSQAVKIGDIIYVAGQIALVPGTMLLVEGGARYQCRLALRHVGRIVKAMDPNTQLRDVVQGICYVTHPSYISAARCEWEKRTNNAIVDYVVVSQLPRGALLEWHVWAHCHNNRFEYEETGCCIGEYRVSIRRRWNYENNVSAVVCYVSTGTVTPAASEGQDSPTEAATSPSSISDSELFEVIDYTLTKLKCNAAPDSVCSLRIFYNVMEGPGPERLLKALSDHDKIVQSLVPVWALHNPSTFLSICGVRHE